MIAIPTISQLYTDILADIQATYGDNVPFFGKVFLRALAAVQAAKLRIFYLVVSSVQKNIFPDTADQEASGGTLERFGRVKLGRNPFPATAGEYVIAVSGSVGATIFAQTTFKSNDDAVNPGQLFILDDDYVFTGTTGTITVRAVVAGLDSKMSVSEGMTATIPIANVSKSATVVSETIPPLAAEDIEDYRSKILDAFRTEPEGGAATDFRLWAADAQGVKQTYPYAKSGAPGEVNLYVEATIADSTDGKGTPSGVLLTAVEAVVELDPDTTKDILDRGRRPLGVFQVHYLPVAIRQVDININGFVGITTDIQTSILNALTLAISEIRPFVAAADILSDKNDLLDVNSIILTVLTANPGSIFGTITLKIDATPVSSFQFLNGDIPYLNSVTYV